MVCRRISPSLPRMKSKWCYLASCLLLSSSFLLGSAEACWGGTSGHYGIMTDDYDIEVGSDLVLNCTIHNTTLKGVDRSVNSSDLTIENGDQNYTKNIRILDDYSIQLRIANATESDSGYYICKLLKIKVVCTSIVKVGYPPLPVSNFSCISRNYENLNCSWEIPKNKVNTKYSIVKSFFNVKALEHDCPNETRRPNSCEWSSKTYPNFVPFYREVQLTVRGNNSLGKSEESFIIDGYAIVIPNSPEQLNVTKVTNTSISIEWFAPTMKYVNVKDSYFPLKYEIWISKILYNTSKPVVYHVGDVKSKRSNYTIASLIPCISYNVSIRCRSANAEREDMWSTFASITVKTESDVPYESPEVIPEAYELHSFKEYRSVTLFWKAVPQIRHNGENFHYHIQYTQDPFSEPSKFQSINSTTPFIEVGQLLKNSSYYFYIHSANEKGLSMDSELIYVAPEDETAPPPKDVYVITQAPGHYNLSWNPPNDVDNFTYIVLWCSSLKHWVSRCDNSIEWIDKNITENNIVLHLTDTKTNFRFAVVSKSDGESSGMQWASCIVPQNGELSKIQSLHVDQINSTTLKVFWYLDCPAEEKLVGRYEITYCAIQENNECHAVEVKPDEKNFFLTDLHPFSNYSIKIRSISHENRASEDSDVVYQSTLPGAPSGPPKNIQVHLQGKNTLSVSWRPPAEPNGIITKYVISYNGTSICAEANASKLVFIASEFKPYSIYAVQMQACVDEHCSEKSEPSMIQTDVEVPGVMKPPIIEGVNETHFKVSWFAPTYPNGPIDFYVIQWHEERQNATSELDNRLEVRGANSVILDVKCPSLGDEEVKYLFYVRAANQKNGLNLLGQLSKPTQAKACRRSSGVGMLVGLIVGAAICAALVLVVIYKFALWMRLKIHQVKSITIRLPEGLEGPETNPLNNYECFKNGLKENLQTSNSERLSYVIDENKNRHGSGSSQFSNSSAEELIFKNGKCTKFGRKPSGDSSGCSSMSSSITPRVHLSSDSGTESDFAIPPSPDSAINEPSLLNSHKNPLPILMEVHDSSAAEKLSVHCSQSPEKHLSQLKNPNGDVILKIDPPYSKFGISGNSNSSTAWRVNPLAFYSCNLANSEPSVFDAQSSKMSEVALPPYSKVGLAKSSGDIGMSAVKQKGYSKFGFPTSQKRFSIPPPNVNPITMVMLENTDRKESPVIKAILDNNCTQTKMAKMGNISLSSNDLDDDCGYIKVGRGNVCSLKPTNGYVPFNDLRSQMNQCPIPVSINANDQIKNGLQDPSADKDQVEIPDVSGWPLFSSGEESRNEDAPEVQFNLPFLSHTSDSPSMEGALYNTDNYGFSITYPENSLELLSTLPSESDIKYNSDSPTLSYNESSLENDSFLQEDENSVTNGDVLYLNGNTTLEESSSGQIHNSKTKTYAVPNEVIVTPMTLRNGYVPFNALSDTVCGRSSNQLPNVSDRRGSKTIFPNGTSLKIDDYFTPSKDDTRLLREDSLPKTVVSPLQKDSLKNNENYIKNGNGYANLSLKYILKPLPKMESEVCEV